MTDDVVVWTCGCGVLNAEIRGKCRCKACGTPRGAMTPQELRAYKLEMLSKGKEI